MSTSLHFWSEDLYYVILNNDILGLEDAILIMGESIRSVLIWADLTAVEYAAKLGHLEQVERLLKELRRYVDDSNDSSFAYYRVCEEVIQHRRKNPELVLQLVSEKSDMMLWLVRTLVTDCDFDFLDKYVLKDEDSKEKYIDVIIRMCFHEIKSPRVAMALPEWVKCRERYIKTIDSLRLARPLLLAIKLGDVQQVVDVFERVHLEVLDILEIPVETYSYIMLDYLVVTSNNEAIQKIVTNSTNLPKLMRLCCYTQSEKMFLDKLLDYAFIFDSPSMVRVMLSNERFEKHSYLSWDQYYFSLLREGKLQLAEMIKHKCGTMEAHALAEICQSLAVLEDYENPFESIQARTTEDILDIVDALESYARGYPELWDNLEIRLRLFPKIGLRPDLVEPFRKFGVDYTMRFVFVYNHSGYPYLLPMYENVAYEYLAVSEESTKFYGRDGYCHPGQRALNGAFLGNSRADVQLGREQALSLKFRELLLECVAQSGRKVVLVNQLDQKEKWKNFTKELETKRRCSLSLLKLCRLVVRSAVGANGNYRHKMHDHQQLIDNIISLYFDGHIPLLLTKFLLYREDTGERPLYYSLFVHEALLGSDPDSDD